MRTRPPPRTQAFTLIEMLAALVVFGVLFSMIVSLLPANTASIIRDVKASEAQIATTQISTAIAADFQRRGTFAGFIRATNTSVNAIFKNSQGFDPTPSADFANDQIMSVPRLKAAVGDHLLIVSSDGTAKILTVTAVNGSAFSHDGCTNGMAAANTQVYKADLLNIVFDGADVLRGLNGGPLVKAGNGGQLQFEYLYRSRTGALLLNPPGAPNNLSTDGSQLAYLKIGVAKDRGGDANAVPLEPSPLRQLIDCQTTLPGAVVDNRLKVTINGLPSGVDADVTTSGPGMPATPTPVTTIYPVRQGTYNVTANPVTVGGVTYTPTVDGAPINMTGYTQRSYVAVTYKPPGINYGGMLLTVTGLNGASSTLDILGPTTFTTSIVDGTLNIDNILPGTYTLRPNPVGSASPSQATYTLVVPSGPRTPITIAYGAPSVGTGNLAITVTGLNGASATAAITGPSGATAFLMDGVVNFNNLPAGNYLLTPTTSGTLSPEQGSYTFAITPGQTTPVTVNYRPGPGNPNPPPVNPSPQPVPVCTVNCGTDIGNLNINVSGLNGLRATARLVGPYTANLTLTDGTTTLTNLPVGTYFLTPAPVGANYPAIATYYIVIVKNATQTVNVIYRAGAPDGVINLRVVGLPNSSPANVNVSGPAIISMDQQDTTAPKSNGKAPVGGYTINAPTATNAQGVSVTPAMNGQGFSLAPGQTVDVVIDYSGNGSSCPPNCSPPNIVCPPNCAPPGTPAPRPGEPPDCLPGYSVAYCNDNHLYGYVPGPHPPVNGPSDPTYNLDGTPRFLGPPAPPAPVEPTTPAPVPVTPADPVGPPAPAPTPTPDPTPAPTPADPPIVIPPGITP